MHGFAVRFKQLRLEKGMTQEELRADFNKKFHRGYRATALSQYENGKRMPEIEALMDFAKYFGVSVSYLLGEIETRNPDSDVEPSPLAVRMDKLSADSQKKALEYMDMLKTYEDINLGENEIDFSKNA